MIVKYVTQDKKAGEVIVDVILKKDERALIRNYYKRKRCTGALIQRAVIEGLENYLKTYDKPLELGKK